MRQEKPLYKFIKKKHAHEFFKNGNIRIGTLYDFRDVEKHGAEIGDLDEGTKTLTTGGYHMLDTADPSTIPSWYAPHFQKSFIPDGPDARLVMHAGGSGISVKLTVPNRYVFCTTEGIDAVVWKQPGYDACIKINSPSGFFKALTNKLKHKAHWITLDRCVYRSRTVIGEHDDQLEPALIKEQRHAEQREVRAIWEAVDHEINPFILKVKKARHFCELLTTSSPR